MFKRTHVIAFLIFLAQYGICLAADQRLGDRGSPEEAVAMVKRVVTSLKTKGRVKTIEEVNSGAYKDRDLSVAIVDFEGRNVAASATHKMIGKVILEARDQDGKYFVKEALEIAKSKGKGWTSYKWPDPYTQKISTKYLYFEAYDGLVISCGSFKEPSK